MSRFVARVLAVGWNEGDKDEIGYGAAYFKKVGKKWLWKIRGQKTG